VFGHKPLTYIAVILSLLAAGCIPSKKFIISNSDGLINVETDNFNLKYYGDYLFFRPKNKDIKLAQKLVNKITTKNNILKKSMVIFRTNTLISPFYEQFLIKSKKINIKNGIRLKPNSTSDPIYYYKINTGGYDYLFIHHQIKTNESPLIDSLTIEKEFLFIMDSITLK